MSRNVHHVVHIAKQRELEDSTQLGGPDGGSAGSAYP